MALSFCILINHHLERVIHAEENMDDANSDLFFKFVFLGYYDLRISFLKGVTAVISPCSQAHLKINQEAESISVFLYHIFINILELLTSMETFHHPAPDHRERCLDSIRKELRKGEQIVMNMRQSVTRWFLDSHILNCNAMRQDIWKRNLLIFIRPSALIFTKECFGFKYRESP